MLAVQVDQRDKQNTEEVVDQTDSETERHPNSPLSPNHVLLLWVGHFGILGLFK